MKDKNSHAIKIFDAYAHQYQEKYLQTDLFHPSYDLFCRRITFEKPEVLDIGCGPGNCALYLLKKRPEFKILGIDGSANMIALAKKNNPNAQFKVMDARCIGQLPHLYHGIFCSFCLPYLSKEETLELIVNIAATLLPGGSVYLSTMEGVYSDSDYQGSSASTGDLLYTHYHEASYLISALEKNGFRDIEVLRIAQTSQETKSVTNLVLIATLSHSV